MVYIYTQSPVVVDEDNRYTWHFSQPALEIPVIGGDHVTFVLRTTHDTHSVPNTRHIHGT